MREVDKLQGDQLKQGKANTKAMQQSGAEIPVTLILTCSFVLLDTRALFRSAKSQGEALAKEAASKTGFNVSSWTWENETEF